jgi:hypothetical protein
MVQKKFEPRMDTDKHGLKRSAGFSPLQHPNALDVRALKRPEGRAPVRFKNPCLAVSICGQEIFLN